MTDAVFADLSPQFATMYSAIGRPSIPPEQLLRAYLRQPYAWFLNQHSAKMGASILTESFGYPAGLYEDYKKLDGSLLKELHGGINRIVVPTNRIPATTYPVKTPSWALLLVPALRCAGGAITACPFYCLTRSSGRRGRSDHRVHLRWQRERPFAHRRPAGPG